MGFLFTPENRAKVLNGAKTQTRRLWKPGFEIVQQDGATVLLDGGRVRHRVGRDYALPVGRGKFGTWLVPGGGMEVSNPLVVSGATSGAAARRFLERHGFLERRIRLLRLWQEPLRDISEEDAVAEGCEPLPEATAYEAYARLWDSINRKSGTRWQDAPLVVVYEFELVERCFRQGYEAGG